MLKEKVVYLPQLKNKEDNRTKWATIHVYKTSSQNHNNNISVMARPQRERTTKEHLNCCVNAQTLRSTAMPLLIQPFARTEFEKCSFRCATPSVWNLLPASVIGRDSLSVFKSRLKHSYFVGPLTSTHNQLPPAPLKLLPYGTLQIYL